MRVKAIIHKQSKKAVLNLIAFTTGGAYSENRVMTALQFKQPSGLQLHTQQMHLREFHVKGASFLGRKVPKTMLTPIAARGRSIPGCSETKEALGKTSSKESLYLIYIHPWFHLLAVFSVLQRRSAFVGTAGTGMAYCQVSNVND